MEITIEQLEIIENALRDNLKAYYYKNETALADALKVVEEIQKRQPNKPLQLTKKHGG